MKRIALAVCTVVLMSSCFTDADDNRIIEDLPVEGVYAYVDPDCGKDDSNKSTFDCTDYVEFLKDFKASVVLRKDSLPYETDYIFNSDKLILKKVPVSDTELSFTIKNDTTLIRLEDDTIWLKE